MKIIHLSHSDRGGGAANACLRLSEALTEKGVESEVWVKVKQKESRNVVLIRSGLREKVTALFVKAIARIIGRALYQGEYISLSATRTGLADLVNSSNADIVHLHWIQAEMVSVEEIGRIKKPIVWTLHDNWPIIGCRHHPRSEEIVSGGWSRDDYRLCGIERFYINMKLKKWKATWVFVCPSKWMKANCERSEIGRKMKHYIIPHFVDREIFKCDVGKRGRRLMVGLVTSHGLREQGKISATLDGINKLVRESKGTLKIVGVDEKERRKLRKEGVLSVGKLQSEQEMAHFYNEVHILLCTSVVESFGLVALEAMACGCVVICRGETGMADIVENGVSGFACNTEEEQLKMIAYLASNRDRLLMMGERAVERAKLFDKTKIVEKHLAVYNELTSKQKEVCDDI